MADHLYLVLPHGRTLERKEESVLEKEIMVMISATNSSPSIEQLYLLIAPSGCDLDRKLQTGWGFEVGTPKSKREIIYPSNILTRVGGTQHISYINHIYTGTGIVARLLADMNAEPEQYRGIKHLAKCFKEGVRKKAGITSL